MIGFIGLFAQYIIVPFLTYKLKFHDTSIIFIDMVTSFANQMILAFATREWMIYLGAAIAFLSNTTSTLQRSTISKVTRAGMCVDFVNMYAHKQKCVLTGVNKAPPGFGEAIPKHSVAP